MKKKLIIIVLLLFLVVGCGKDIVRIESKAERDAKRELANVEDINKENIQESLDYISKYLNGIKKTSGNYGTLYRHVYKINYICSKDSSFKENKVCKVGSLSTDYINNHKRQTIKEINDLLDEIDDSNEIKELVEKYHSKVSYKSDLDEIKEKVLKESKTEGFITKDKLTKATNYLLDNYSKPFADSEVLYKITYYTEYLSKVGSLKKENELITFSNLVKEYINNQDEKTKQKIESKINNIESKKEQLIKELL